MASVIRTSLRTVLQRIKDKITTDLLLGPNDVAIPSERVLLTIRGKVPKLQGDSDIVIRPRGLKVRREVTDYGGRHDTRINRRIEIICRTRLELDPVNSDEVFLLDSELGHIAFEELVIDCLQDALLTESDDSDNAILCCGMLLEEGQDTRPDAEASRGAGWGETSLFFSVEYSLAFTELPT